MVKKDKNRVNVKARLNRHLRIIKENIKVDKKTEKNSDKKNKLINFFHYNIIIFFILLVLPIYPTLASLLYENSRYEFYRGNIDESNIIESYYGGDNKEEVITAPILESTDSFISVNTILDDERDVAGSNEVVEYEVKPGDSFSVIAYKFKVSTNSIYWANNFTKKHTLQPGEIIKVPPVTGLIHQVVRGDTLSSVAKKYDIEAKKIIEQNGLENNGKLIVGDIIVIPGAIKKAPPKPKPVYKKPAVKQTIYKKSVTNKPKPTGYNFVRSGTQYVNSQGKYKLVWRKPYSGAWGNCTYYVASYKNVNWRGNANSWIKNARAKGHKTGMTPKIGSIVQFTGRGYNPRYGHVAIVMDITSTHIIVSEMNYRKLNEVTYRKVLINDRAIDGYIYIN